MMTTTFRLAALAALTLSCATAQDEKWTPIFNGKDLDGWTPKIQGLALGEDPKKTFIVEDGAIKVSYANYTEWATPSATSSTKPSSPTTASASNTASSANR